MLQTKRALVITLIAVVAVMAGASTMMPKPVYAPGKCMSCFTPGQQEGAAQNSAPGIVSGGINTPSVNPPGLCLCTHRQS